jgi:hypothetical protein
MRIDAVPPEAKIDGHAIGTALVPPGRVRGLDSGDLSASKDVGHVAARHISVSHRFPRASRNHEEPFFVHDVPSERPGGLMVEGLMHEGDDNRN